MDFQYIVFTKMARSFLKIAGYFPSQPRRFQRLLRNITKIALAAASIGMISKTIISKPDFITLLGKLPNIAIFMAIAILTFVIDALSDINIKVFEQINDDWRFSDMNKELKIRENYAALGRRLMDYYLTSFNWFAILYVAGIDLSNVFVSITSSFNESRPIQQLFEMDFVFIDHEKHWFLTMIYVHFCFCAFHIFSLSVQSIFVVDVCHLFGMFEILSYRLETVVLTYNIDNPMSDEKTQPKKVNCNAVTRCIQQHQRLLKSIYDNIYSVTEFPPSNHSSFGRDSTSALSQYSRSNYN
ncbi:uncharacterized protein [Prorops nasuta]|uniref:uncharacterized protein n=1 Tax=Prorops nasuta TaxID=863751 RepID=UPI0034CE2DCB